MQTDCNNTQAASTCVAEQVDAFQNLMSGLSRYNIDFFIPYLISMAYFGRAEMIKGKNGSIQEQWKSYMDLLQFNAELWGKGFTGSMRAMEGFLSKEMESYFTAFENSISGAEGETLHDFYARQLNMLKGVGRNLPRAIEEIEPEYGFHFERGENPLVAQTERFWLYRIEPTDPKVKIDETGKPLLIIPPFVLGSNILCFLPGENKSYTHCFANQGIPTYIRIMKDIHETPALQTMTMEDDAMDTKVFCEKIMETHGKKVTLNGYCQGGFSAVCHILSDELDDVVDALITCVAPMDGTRSKSLGDFLRRLPDRFNDLLYGTKTLPNGNEVADGQLMGWVYKLKSIEDEAPVVAFFRDMFMVSQMERHARSISKTAAALNYWLKNERTDIPMSITQMSFASYNIPVTDDGTLAVTLFGRKLNFKGIEKKKIPWLLCYGESDDLVEKETALAPADFIEVEAVPFPKGHVAIATSWSHPESAYALHTRFGPDNQYRGPVRFQLDLNETLDKKAKAKKVAKKPAKKDNQADAEKESEEKGTVKKAAKKTEKKTGDGKAAGKTAKKTTGTAKKKTAGKTAQPKKTASKAGAAGKKKSSTDAN